MERQRAAAWLAALGAAWLLTKGGAPARSALGWMYTPVPVPALLRRHAREIEALRCASVDSPGSQDERHLLRLVLEHGGDVPAALKNMRQVANWRAGEGRPIVDAARRAVDQALKGPRWDNVPVLEAAPSTDIISKFITPSQMMRMSLPSGNLCICFRPAAIDTFSLMNAISEQQLSDWFLYTREVDTLVADHKTLKSGRLITLAVSNDLADIGAVPDPRFVTAVMDSSRKAEYLYPGFAGAILILNAPPLIQPLLDYCTPLLPGGFKRRIKVATERLDIKDLRELLELRTRGRVAEKLDAMVLS